MHAGHVVHAGTTPWSWYNRLKFQLVLLDFESCDGPLHHKDNQKCDIGDYPYNHSQEQHHARDEIYSLNWLPSKGEDVQLEDKGRETGAHCKREHHCQKDTGEEEEEENP